MKDVADGRCAGPFDTADEVLNHLGTRRAAISRRFGQVQGAQVRPCDVRKRSYVNKGWAARRRLRLSTTESFCHTWRYTRGAARALGVGRSVITFTSNCGSTTSGTRTARSRFALTTTIWLFSRLHTQEPADRYFSFTMF